MKRTNFEDFKQKALSDPNVRTEYNKIRMTQQLRINLIQIRKEAGLTIEDVANRMHTSKSNVSRLESVEYFNKHSPKISTIENYAEACGKHLEFCFGN